MHVCIDVVKLGHLDEAIVVPMSLFRYCRTFPVDNRPTVDSTGFQETKGDAGLE